jgi:hypothetical protein
LSACRGEQLDPLRVGLQERFARGDRRVRERESPYLSVEFVLGFGLLPQVGPGSGEVWPLVVGVWGHLGSEGLVGRGRHGGIGLADPRLSNLPCIKIHLLRVGGGSVGLEYAAADILREGEDDRDRLVF